ncbi:MAG: hypothetical protein JWS12_200 [Candidatus Saccharibacteria bacterium]|nr:hypothetical protein [Candidatus Saccharibacteria bacterium]
MDESREGLPSPEIESESESLRWVELTRERAQLYFLLGYVNRSKLGQHYESLEGEFSNYTDFCNDLDEPRDPNRRRFVIIDDKRKGDVIGGGNIRLTEEDSQTASIDIWLAAHIPFVKKGVPVLRVACQYATEQLGVTKLYADIKSINRLYCKIYKDAGFSQDEEADSIYQFVFILDAPTLPPG